MKILIGSKNKVKIEAAKEVFSAKFENTEVMDIEVPSGVSNQPKNDEIFKGAENRAIELKKINDEKNIGADFFVGMEAGIIKAFSRWFNTSITCVMDKTGKKGFGTSLHFELPDSVVQELLKGDELGDVMDKIAKKKNIKHNEGAIGFFTDEEIKRKDLCTQSLRVALIPFLKKDLF